MRLVFDSRIVASQSPWFDSSWIGRRIDAGTLAQMEELAARPMVEGGAKALDLGGERGEYHTMCLDGPLYRWPIKLAESQGRPRELEAMAGQKEGDRWWSLSW